MQVSAFTLPEGRRGDYQNLDTEEKAEATRPWTAGLRPTRRANVLAATSIRSRLSVVSVCLCTVVSY